MPSAAALRRARVLVVGDVMLDRYLFGEVSRISPEAPVPVVRVVREEERPGGAANVARNAAALGAQVTLLSVIGADEVGERLRRLIVKEGINASLWKDVSLETTRKVRVIGRQQQLLRIDFEQTPSEEILMKKLGVYRKLLNACDVVILSDYGKGGLTHIVRMIEMARACGKWILVDPKGDDYSRYHGANVLTPNRSELRDVVGQWSNEADLTARAQALRRKLAVDALLVTRSEEGMTLFDDDVHAHCSARILPISSSRDATAVPSLPTTMPAAWLAARMASRKPAPAAIMTASVAITVSPAPLTSYTSRAFAAS